MPGSEGYSAVHYYYLLKEDEGDRQRLWSLLTSEIQLSGEPADGLALGLTQVASEVPGQCRTMQRASDDEVDYCLMSLPDLTAIAAIYRPPASSGPGEAWRSSLDRVKDDRSRVLDAGITVFGETTLLVVPVSAGPDLGGTMGNLFGEPVLENDLFLKGSGGQALLAHSLVDDRHRHDYYGLAADDAELFSFDLFPHLDTLVKKISRVASLFGHQRRTIIEQRNDIDRQVSSILHQEVVAGADTAQDTQILEERITSLSRMFGILATDSLLVRQAEERLRKETRELEATFDEAAGVDPGARDEIGSHYVEIFLSDLDAARVEASNLDFSRRNAQAAIEVVRTQVELVRAGEEAAIQEQSKQLLSRSLLLQQERLSLQVAAGFVEFVLVFYYALKSWEGVAGTATVEHVSPVLLLVVVGGFSGSAAVGTHFLAQALHKNSWKNIGLWISALILGMSFTAMVLLTIANK